MSSSKLAAHDVCAQLLELLEDEPEGLTFAELVDELDKPASTIHTGVRILDKHGQIYPDRCYELDELETVTWRATRPGGAAA
jgi:DNA-binding IclR family transcriptional regulator